jgi:hypothetical protein
MNDVIDLSLLQLSLLTYLSFYYLLIVRWRGISVRS